MTESRSGSQQGLNSIAQAGVYALIRLDGVAVSAREADVLGLINERPTSAAIAGTDPIEPGAVHCRRTAGSTTLLLGHVDESASVVSRLGLEPGTTSLDLVSAAYERFGDDTPRELFGSWVFVHWDETARRLTLVKSINQTYQVFVARRGHKLALAPELTTLARLDWIGSDIDEQALITVLASARLETPFRAPTMLRHVTLLKGGHVARFDGAGDRVIAINPRVPPTVWKGSFDDALAAVETVLRQIVSGTANRATGLGVTLSGGLDSSLLAWIAAGERRTDRPFALLTAGAPAEYGLSDDVPLASAVARHLEERLHPVIPPSGASPYRPTVAEMRMSNRPTMAPILFSSRALADAADQLGTSHLLYGSMGELTVTASARLASPLTHLRRIAGVVRRRGARYDLRERWPEAAFAPWLAPRLLARVPRGWIRDHRLPPYEWPIHRSGTPWGYPAMLDTFLAPPIWDPVPGKLRTLSPFLDIRLLRLFAGMPIDFAQHDGVHRAVARQMLAGHLPDAIRLHPKMPPSAGYHQRLRDHAATAMARLPLFRRAGIGAWLDLDRIEGGLKLADRFERIHGDIAFRTQLSVQAAEYFLWWLAGRPNEDHWP